MSKKTSFVWNFFHIKDNEKQMAECDLCRTLLCFKSSVTNLKKHLQRKHPTIKLNVPEKSKIRSLNLVAEDLTKSQSNETDRAVSTNST